MTDPASQTTASLVERLRLLSRESEIRPVIIGNYDRAVISEVARRLMTPEQIAQTCTPVICDTTRRACHEQETPTFAAPHKSGPDR